ncbi:hypothetical protein PA25_08450 [Pseudoalteromonas sp. A25]|uniref:peptidylprolyl isomerase n=1 Tax=Pseudoalteromonas sp. A25 TaxID=116092 RepID=UPI0012608105|nr:peptidylprolyl isomerase [Pseudoalteromonas sp. A25]BBN80860.1 hypothetical protein PA25_08450 [Pseudoalteromonas sp. A25]
MRVLLLFLASFICLPTFAQALFNSAEVKLVQQLLKKKNPAITLVQTESRLLENAFLLDQAKQRIPKVLTKQSPVGFSSDYHARRYTLSLLTSQFTLPSIPELDTNAWRSYSSKWLTTHLPSYPSNNTYTQAQLKKLETINLSHLVSGPLTLATLMAEQSMQNRYKLHQGDIALFKTLIGQHRRFNLIIHKLTDKLTAQNLSSKKLKEIAKAELLRPVMLTYFGVAHSLHGERSDYLEAIQIRIEEQAIHRFYENNKHNFKYIQKVQASGALFKDKVKAEQFHKYASDHDFNQALLHFKQVDLFANEKGLVQRQKHNAWTQQVVFSLPTNQLSKPIRSPNGLWFVAQTTRRFYEYYDKDSETVKYQARLALTDAMAKAAYHELKTNWLKSKI